MTSPFSLLNEWHCDYGGLSYSFPRFALKRGSTLLVTGPAAARPEFAVALLTGTIDDSELRESLFGSGGHQGPLLDSKPIYQGAARSSIGAVAGMPDLNIVGRTVIEDYLHSLEHSELHATESQVVAVALRPYGLSEKLFYHSDTLSGGEKQRLNCATALSSSRRLLSLDLVESSLDREFRKFLNSTISAFTQSGGITIAAGLDSDDALELKGVVTARLEKSGSQVKMVLGPPDALYAPGRSIERQELASTLLGRAAPTSKVLRAAGVYRKGRSQPLSLEVGNGEVVLLTGPNGSGKTTFADVVAGRVNKREIKGSLRLDPSVRAVLATQRASDSILGVDLISELPDEDLRRICGVGEARDCQLDPRGFSPGTQKLLGAANALRLSRGLVVLDEPSSGMDFSQKQRLVQLLNRFTSLACLIVTHDEALTGLGREVSFEIGESA